VIRNVAQPPPAVDVAQPPPAVDVAQPPPAVDVAQPPPAVTAKPARSSYRRNLPHLQREGAAVYVTFSTYKGLVLPERVRSLVLEHCVHDHGKKAIIHGVVVMPDHVHMVFTPLGDEQGNTFGLADIMSSIKGASAHRVNKALGRRGHVWQDESFDHIPRSDESIRQKVEYICANPVRKRLVQSVDDYPWLWREWVEGVAAEGRCATPDTAEGRCAT